MRPDPSLLPQPFECPAASVAGVVNEARRKAPPSQIVIALLHQARRHLADGQVVQSFEAAQEAEHLCRAECFTLELIHVHLLMGACWLQAQDHDHALQRLNDALQAARQQAHIGLELCALRTLVQCHTARSDFRTASLHIEAALKIVHPDSPAPQQAEFLAWVCDGLARQSQALIDEGHPFEASAYHDRALRLLRPFLRQQDQLAASDAGLLLLDTLSRLYVQSGCASSALRFAKMLRQRSVTQQHPNALALSSERTADALLLRRRPHSAARWLRLAQHAWRESAQPQAQLHTLDRLVALLTQQGRHAQALRLSQQARTLEQEAQASRLALRIRLTELALRAAVPADTEATRRACAATLAHQQRLLMLGQMVTSIAHEMVQPLAAMRLMAENALLQRSQANKTDSPSTRALAAVDHAFSKIIRLLDHTTEYVEQIKRFARKGSPAPANQLVPMSCIVEDALLIVEAKRKQLGIQIEQAVTAHPVVSDRQRATAIVVNLLSNAMDAAAGSRWPHIEIASRTADEHGVIEVRDHGPGLSPSVLASLEAPEPFVTTKDHGLGVGLPLSIDLADQMGAELVGSNHPHGGAVFRLRFPLAPHLLTTHRASPTAPPAGAFIDRPLPELFMP